MNYEPVLFPSTMFETANEAFLFCKDYLEKTERRAAAHLAGLDPINSKTMGRLALRALLTIQHEVRDAEGRRYIAVAIHALMRAVEERQLHAVA